jgi:ligand-binding sensor domain-containing protein
MECGFMKTLWLFLTLVSVCSSKNLQDWQVFSYMNNITDIISKENTMWVSTTGGAYAYNTIDSTCIKFTTVEGLGSLNLSSLAADRYDNIYFGAQQGLLTVYNKVTNHWWIYSELANENINDLSLKDDTLWAATQQGVAVFLIIDNKPQFRDLYQNFPEIPNRVNRVLLYNNSVFLATDSGLFYAPSNFTRYNLKDANIWTILDINSGLPSNSVYDIIESSKTLVIGTADGLCCLDQNFNLQISNEWIFGAVTRLFQSNQNLFAANANKIYTYQNSDWQENGRYTKPISCGDIDSAGNLWLGFQDGGLQKKSWLKPLIIDGPADNYIGRLTKDKNNNIWMMSGIPFSPTAKGFYQYNFNYWNSYFFSGPSKIDWKNSTSTVFADPYGNIWIGCWGGGVALLKSEEIICYHAFPGGGDLHITNYMNQQNIQIEEVPEERRYCFPPSSSKAQPQSMNISQFISDDQGNLWCADYGALGARCIVILPKLSDGTYALNCDQWIYYGPHINLSSAKSEITCMEFDVWGRLWFGTYSEGVYILDYNGTLYNLYDDKLFIPEGYDNLLSNRVLSLKMDHDGIMWIGTAGGLNSYDGRQLYRHLGESGELGPVDNKINQIFVDLYNNKWFATDGGISVLDGSKSPWEAVAWNHYTPENSGLPSKYTKSIFVDNQQGKAYIGTDNGLAIFKGIFAQLRENYDRISAGPNPFIIENNSQFVLKNLMVKSTVKIFTINSKLIRILSPNDGSVQGSRAIWDGRDSHHNIVSSGVYLYLAYAEDGTASQGKIAVIRP